MRDPILYRWWGADGRLLYVGKSISLFNRIAQHRRSSSFFTEAAMMTIKRYDTPEELAAAEIHAIETEGPRYNIMHAPRGIQSGTRKITVWDGDGPTLDRSVGHWVPADVSDIHTDALIRVIAPDEEILILGVVDEETDDEDGWYVICDDGMEDVLLEEELEVCEIDKWVCALEHDELRANILSKYYGRRSEAWAERLGVA